MDVRTTTPAPSVAIRDVSFRPFDASRDYPGITAAMNAEFRADGIQWAPSVAQIRNDYEHRAEFDVTRDAIVAEADGRIVAFGSAHRTIRDGSTHFRLDWAVDPDWRHRGIETAILSWLEARARDRLAEEPGVGEPNLTSWVEDTQTGALAVLAATGFRQVRFGFMMLRDLREPIPDVALPPGLEIRPVEEAQHRAIFDAENEAFRDHWNHREQDESDFVRTYSEPDLDTSLWRVAWDGDEVAAVVQNYIFPEENAALGVSRGWLEHISTRRPWRRRGLASALTIASFHAFRERGIEEAALGVDSQNPNGALGLYERLGFRRIQTGIAHRKDL